MIVKSRNKVRSSNTGIDPVGYEDLQLRRLLQATSVVAELVVTLQADDPARPLYGQFLVVSEMTTYFVASGTLAQTNAAYIPMPTGARVQHLLDALKVDDGDVQIAIKLLSIRFAEANAEGKKLSIFDDAIAGPSVALHLAIQEQVAQKV